MISWPMINSTGVQDLTFPAAAASDSVCNYQNVTERKCSCNPPQPEMTSSCNRFPGCKLKLMEADVSAPVRLWWILRHLLSLLLLLCLSSSLWSSCSHEDLDSTHVPQFICTIKLTYIRMWSAEKLWSVPEFIASYLILLISAHLNQGW